MGNACCVASSGNEPPAPENITPYPDFAQTCVELAHKLPFHIFREVRVLARRAVIGELVQNSDGTYTQATEAGTYRIRVVNRTGLAEEALTIGTSLVPVNLHTEFLIPYDEFKERYDIRGARELTEQEKGIVNEPHLWKAYQSTKLLEAVQLQSEEQVEQLAPHGWAYSASGAPVEIFPGDYIGKVQGEDYWKHFAQYVILQQFTHADPMAHPMSPDSPRRRNLSSLEGGSMEGRSRRGTTEGRSSEGAAPQMSAPPKRGSAVAAH